MPDPERNPVEDSSGVRWRARGRVGPRDRAVGDRRTCRPITQARADHPLTITTLVLEEFRLRAGADDGAAARIVAAFSDGNEEAVPLLTSIDDRRDVATVRALHDGEATDPAERVALDPLVASWRSVKRYGPRMIEHADGLPSYYRLAVTESGINTPGGRPAPSEPTGATGALVRLDLLWIGTPLDTYAGLMVLIGSDAEGDGGRSDWALPLSDDLGVRIYESRG